MADDAFAPQNPGRKALGDVWFRGAIAIEPGPLSLTGPQTAASSCTGHWGSAQHGDVRPPAAEGPVAGNEWRRI